MKNLFFLLAVASGLALSAFKTAPIVDAYSVDAKNSSIEWVGKKVTGQHNGFLGFKNGSLDFADGKLTGGSFVADMTSITCADLQGEWADKLLGHLKSPDFFNVAANPTATLTIKKAIALDTKGNYKIIGDLTIKGITKEIRFPATVAMDGGKVSAKGNLRIDRSDYDIRYGSGSFFDGLGDKTIYDEFDLNFSVVATK